MYVTNMTDLLLESPWTLHRTDLFEGFRARHMYEHVFVAWNVQDKWFSEERSSPLQFHTKSNLFISRSQTRASRVIVWPMIGENIVNVGPRKIVPVMHKRYTRICESSYSTCCIHLIVNRRTRSMVHTTPYLISYRLIATLCQLASSSW